jgi:hypothetical protein
VSFLLIVALTIADIYGILHMSSKQHEKEMTMTNTINHTECWNEINMQDIAESCEFCKVVTLNPFTGVKESHIMVPSDKVLEGLKNGGLKRYSERSQIVSVDADDINRLW